jgi:hypothetical protein
VHSNRVQGRLGTHAHGAVEVVGRDVQFAFVLCDDNKRAAEDDSADLFRWNGFSVRSDALWDSCAHVEYDSSETERRHI